MTATIIPAAAQLQTKLAKSAATAWAPAALKLTYDVTLIHSESEDEKLVTVLSPSDRFIDVVKAIRAAEPDRKWEIYETLEQPF